MVPQPWGCAVPLLPQRGSPLNHPYHAPHLALLLRLPFALRRDLIQLWQGHAYMSNCIAQPHPLNSEGTLSCLFTHHYSPFMKTSILACGQAYGHAYELASCFAELPMGVEVLVQIDRLVQLLETPVFNFLRLHLLHPARYPALLWSAPNNSCCSSLPCHVHCASMQRTFLCVLPPIFPEDVAVECEQQLPSSSHDSRACAYIWADSIV